MNITGSAIDIYTARAYIGHCINCIGKTHAATHNSNLKAVAT